MGYDEFVNAVQENMKNRLGESAKVSVYSTVKNNGKAKKGIMIETPGVNVAPTIYLEEFYESFLKGEDFEKIMEDFADFYEDVQCTESWECENLREFDSVKDRIVFRLVNTKLNSELLCDVPHIRVLDLSIVFYVIFELSEEGTASMLIRNDHMEIWEKDKNELWDLAKKNSGRMLPAEFFTMEYALFELMDKVGGREEESPQRENLLLEKAGKADFMYVLSNQIRHYGAACMMYPHIMDMVGEIMGDDFFVIPSSIHEVIIVPKREGLMKSSMDEMVREINASQLKEEEVLSDHVYYYERRTERLISGYGS